jgi:hypothetical protein
MSAVEIALERILSTNSEGFRADVYDDETDLRIECQGEPTIGFGCRCRQWSRELAECVLRFQLGEAEAPLLKLPWYRAANEARQSALLEIAFNEGDGGLLNGFPRLVAAAEADNWVQSGIECHVRDPRLTTRYARLAKILVTGECQ